jgi:hypothetical protein
MQYCGAGERVLCRQEKSVGSSMCPSLILPIPIPERHTYRCITAASDAHESSTSDIDHDQAKKITEEKRGDQFIITYGYLGVLDMSQQRLNYKVNI